MKRITKFILNLTSVGSIVLIATLNASQFAVMKGATPTGTDSPGTTIPGGAGYIQPIEDMDAPPTARVRSVRGGCGSGNQVSVTP